MHAQRISLSADRFHLPAHGSNHGPLCAVALAASRAMFGDGPAGWRVLNVVASCALCLLLFGIARFDASWFGAALVVALAAGNTVLLYYAIYAVQSNWFLLWTMASLFFLLRAETGGRRRDLFAAAFFLGVNGLTYQGAALLVPGMVGFCALHLRRRFRLIDFAIAVLIATAVMSPYLVWLLSSDQLDYVRRHAAHAAPATAPLAIPELLIGQMWATSAEGPVALGFQTLDFPTGITLALTTVAALVLIRRPFQTLMFAMLASLVVGSLVFRRAESRHFLPFIPVALALAPSGIGVLVRNQRVRRGVFVALAGGALITGVLFVRRAPDLYPLHTEAPLQELGGEGVVDLNVLVKGLSKALEPFAPTLIAMPDDRLHSILHYLAAVNDRPIVGPMKENRFLPIWPEDRKRIAVLLLDGRRAPVFFAWAKQQGARVEGRRVTVPLGAGARLPAFEIVEIRLAKPLTRERWDDFVGLVD